MRALRFSSAFIALFSLAACATAPGAAPTAAKPAASAPSAPVFRLADIQGKTPAAVDALLGAPALTRKEGSGEYRRYSLSSCALIVIVYPDAAGAPKVAHVDASALNAGADKPDVEGCLAKG